LNVKPIPTATLIILVVDIVLPECASLLLRKAVVLAARTV